MFFEWQREPPSLREGDRECRSYDDARLYAEAMTPTLLVICIADGEESEDEVREKTVTMVGGGGKGGSWHKKLF